MEKFENKDWHQLSVAEQKKADALCNNGKHGSLYQEKGPGGGTGDYICRDCGVLKSGAEWRRQGLL
ncbi:MAG: hypothetical protein OXT49_03625 [Gammaproteobacteria bacterium]|nr:hypothetical protein [Gammaproteobacteria bacterium]